MANLTKNANSPGGASYTQEMPGAKRPKSYQITNGTQLYTCSFVMLSSGRLTQYDGATGSLIEGYVQPTPSISFASGAQIANLLGNTSATPIPEASVETGQHVLVQVAVTGASAITDVGALVYLASDDNTVTKTQPNSSAPLGEITRWYTSTTCDVRVWSVDERRAYRGS